MPETARCDPDTAHCYVVMTAASTTSLGSSRPFWQNACGRKDARLRVKDILSCLRPTFRWDDSTKNHIASFLSRDITTGYFGNIQTAVRILGGLFFRPREDEVSAATVDFASRTNQKRRSQSHCFLGTEFCPFFGAISSRFLNMPDVRHVGRHHDLAGTITFYHIKPFQEERG
jgi:hypothetical protein